MAAGPRGRPSVGGAGGGGDEALGLVEGGVEGGRWSVGGRRGTRRPWWWRRRRRGWKLGGKEHCTRALVGSKL
jgi:hypothetical protein